MAFLQSLVAAALLVASPTAPAATPGPASLQWAPCPGTDIGTECATLTLPVDWSDPAGPTFGLQVARHRGTAATGTLVFGPGGPGDSGVDRLRTAENFDRFSDELQRRFDIVSFDPRGVGGSHAMPCPVDASAVPADQASFTALVAANRAAWAACRQSFGPLWDHAGTASAVRDLEALRVALGGAPLTFHGTSYGALLGEQYAERYPSHVRAMVLEGADDHSLDTRGFLGTETWALQDSFDEFARWCAGAEACALHGRDVHEVWAGLVAAAGENRLQGWSEWDLTTLVHFRMTGPAYSELAGTLAQLAAGTPVPEIAVPPVVTATFCADWALPVRDFASYERLVRQTRTRDFRYSAGSFAIGSCLGWPQPVANPQHRLHVHLRTPLLQLAGRHDPATGYNWARSVARQLGPSGVLLTYAGAGHGTYRRDCVAAHVDTYLLTLRLPPRATVCPAEG